MNTVRRTSTLLASLLLAMATLLAIGPAVVAVPVEPPGGGPGSAPQGPQVVRQDLTPMITHNGSPLWVFGVVALVAIAVTLATVLLLVKARPALRRRLAHA